MANKDIIDGVSPSNQAHVLINRTATMTPVVVGNTDLLAAVSEEDIERGGERREETCSEGEMKTYSVTRKHSGKRMRCELEGEGEGGKAVKRRHTIYISTSRDNIVSNIRASKSTTALSQSNSDLSPKSQEFKFSRPLLPPNTPVRCTPVPVTMVTNTESVSKATKVSSHPFTFSNPRLYQSKKQVVANDNDKECTAMRLFDNDDGICKASPIPTLPELRPPIIPPVGQLNEGFLRTPLPLPPQSIPSSSSPNLLEKITSELVERYPLATPLATPTCVNNVGLLNHRAVYTHEPVNLVKPVSHLVKPVPFNFNDTISPEQDDSKSSKVMQEVSFTFELNPTTHGCHGDTTKQLPSNHGPRIPLSPLHTLSTTTTNTLKPLKPPLQRKFALTPLITRERPIFTDIITSSHITPLTTTMTSQTIFGKTPKMKK